MYSTTPPSPSPPRPRRVQRWASVVLPLIASVALTLAGCGADAPGDGEAIAQMGGDAEAPDGEDAEECLEGCADAPAPGDMIDPDDRGSVVDADARDTPSGVPDLTVDAAPSADLADTVHEDTSDAVDPDTGGGGVCGGGCALGTMDACTCSAGDPCGWRGDGVCDWACWEFVNEPFDDLEDCDEDRDGLPDPAEFELARAYRPELVFSSTEVFEARQSFWSVSPAGEGHVQIFYALGYHEDGGDPDLLNAYAHLGDSEFIVVEVSGTETLWWVTRVFLSSHYQAPTDSSGWHAPGELEWVAGPWGEAQRPVVWAAEWKHANYVSREACDAGGFFSADYCDTQGWSEPVAVLEERNVGTWPFRRIDGVSQPCAAGSCDEFFDSDVRFCGWRVAPWESRADCAPEANSYARQLDDWRGGQL